MQSLIVQALAMRQLGRLNPRHLLAPGYGLRQTEWCPRAIHTRQLWGCAAFPALGCHRPAAIRGRDTIRGWSVHRVRFKSNKKKGPTRKAQEEEEEDEDEKDSDFEDEVDENPNISKDYKDIEKHVQSFRYDVIMKAGLDMARK